MIKILGILISLLLFFAAWEADASDVSMAMLSGALFFLSLSIGAFFEKKHMILFIGIALFFMLLFQLATGEAFLPTGRRSQTLHATLLDNPSEFWKLILISSCLVLATLIYGVYAAYYKKKSDIPDNDKISSPSKASRISNRDMKKLGKLFSNLQLPPKELRDKAEPLLAKLELKYKENAQAMLYIKEKSDYIAKLILMNSQKDELMIDIETIIDLLEDVTSSSELKIKSALLMANFEHKYKGNDTAQQLLEQSKEFISEQMTKLTESEATEQSA